MNPLHLIFTNVYDRNRAALRNPRIRRAINQGGTSSSKTYSILQLLIHVATGSKKPLIISIVAESLPHLKRGAMRDFFAILGDAYKEENHNKTNYTYKIGKCIIEFFSADNSTKLRGGRRDILFINECNNITYEAFRELDKRTRIFTFLDFNPTNEFWAHEFLIPFPENDFIHSTYLDARQCLEPSVVKNIESERDKDPNWWNIYGMGLVGKISGLVYPKFNLIDSMPDLARCVEVFGLDFGFSGDPAVLTRHLIVPGQKRIYSDELFYERDLLNAHINQKMLDLKMEKNGFEIFSDSADPKDIADLCTYGWNVLPCIKGPGSVEFGIKKVNEYEQFWTKSSTNCIKEQRNCMYIKDKDGNLTDKITHYWTHGLDSRRYALVTKLYSDDSGYDLEALSQM